MGKKKFKEICKWDKGDFEKYLAELGEIVREPKYACKSCGRVSRTKKYVCKPLKLENPTPKS